MDAKTFLTKKHDAAVEEMRVIEAEYKARIESAQAMIVMTRQWLDELGGEKAPDKSRAEAAPSPQDIAKSNPWVSNRDLSPGGA